ncbi:sensor histidine kinase [Streptomyces sp. SP18BB07]|uniref:sensor histidine kinase n=1 Tax=Streptomyces sp. SP18BB07 TaxID=3002522 RepID=UPI002E777351|nr:ATP-binding protein [Streptomyces sp. SP18BB07]MEE1761807.1 ATP-binding protein [Streptomyces sp. SP18BB07]
MTAPSPPRPPGERPALRSVLPLPLVTAVLSATAVGSVVASAQPDARIPLTAGAGATALLLTVAVAVAVHARVSVRLLRQRLDAVSRETGLLLQERARTAEEHTQERGRLTEEFVQERARIAAEFARERIRLTTEAERERERLTDERDRTAQETAQERSLLTERAERAETERTALLAVTANVAGRMQALATGTLADLRAMEERHADEDVLADLLHLDHRTAQAGRLADSVAVLAGARSGRRWARPIPMESILRGAMGRIGAYRRVRLHSSSEAAVAGHAAEGVMHALAELLDNAANFSPPTAEVHVYVEEVPAGAIISVEDSGLVMSDIQLRRAERAVAGETADLTSLSGTRLGLAVVGRLARKHGLKISFRPSARGGTGVLMLIPQDVLASTIPTTTSPASTSSGTSAPFAPPTYAGVRAPRDLDAEPTPMHEFPPEAPAAPVADPVADALIDSLSGFRRPPAAPPTDATTGSPSDGAFGSPAHRAPYTSPFTSSFSSEFGSDTGSDTSSDTGSPFGSGSPVFDTESVAPATPGEAADDTTATASAPSDALPRRRRGQSLAEAEARTRAHAPGAEARPERVSRPAEEASTGAVRFSSFRRAVRGTGGLDQAFVQGTATGDDSSTGAPVAPTPPDPAAAMDQRANPAAAVDRYVAPAGPAAPEAALEPVREAAPPAETVRQPELEPVREHQWGAVGGTAWEPGPEPELGGETGETGWAPGPAPEAGWEPEPARGLAWQPEAAKQAAWEAEAAAELPWAPDPAREAKWELDPVRETAWEPVRETRPAPHEDTAPTPDLAPLSPYGDPATDPDPNRDAYGKPDPYTAPAPDPYATPAPYAAPDTNPYAGSDPYPDPDPYADPTPGPAGEPPRTPDPRTHPHLEGDDTP